jgi:tryptophan 2,3-dioxygenase
METSQFNKFRKALLPASGFQTYQFRLIEIMLTPFENLIKKEIRDNLSKPITIEKHYNNIYWRSGAIDKATNEPTKVLINFNKKYDKKFKKILTEFHNKNIYSRYLNSDLSFQKKVKIAMKDVENNILLWKIAHLRAVERYIHSSLSGTGGTKWDDYLPVLKQKILYFPDFWIGNDFESEIQKLISDFPEKIKNEINELFSENS